MTAGCTYFDVFMSTAEANDCPTKRDVQETKRLLRDFCIQVSNIPKFMRRYELLNWRTDVINAKL